MRLFKHLFVYLLNLGLSLQAQTWEWAHSLKSLGELQTIMLSDERVVMVGAFSTTCEIKNKIFWGGTYSRNIILAGFSANGELEWTKQLSTAQYYPLYIAPMGNEFIFATSFSSVLAGSINEVCDNRNFILCRFSGDGQLLNKKLEGGQGQAD